MASVIGTGTVLKHGGHALSSKDASRRDAEQRQMMLAGNDDQPNHLELDILVEAEIIPRLLMAHTNVPPEQRSTGSGEISAEDAARFAPLPLELEAHDLLTEVERFLDRGVSVDSIFVDLLAPSARQLGEYWTEDRCDFIDVTMGLWRLQEVMREIAIRGMAYDRQKFVPHSALFTPMPGEQHSFGALMVEEVFSLAGWQSEVLIEPARKDVLQSVSQRSYDLVGLTLSCSSSNSAIADLISSIRSVSKNSEVGVMIGGQVVNADPTIVGLVGADGTASNARAALALAEQMVARLEIRLP